MHDCSRPGISHLSEKGHSSFPTPMKTLIEARSPNAGFTSLILVLAAAIPAVAADRKVPKDYATIQAAVDAASNGDTIQIASGVYVETVRILSKQLTLVGQSGTILRASEAMPLPPDS